MGGAVGVRSITWLERLHMYFVSMGSDIGLWWYKGAAGVSVSRVMSTFVIVVRKVQLNGSQDGIEQVQRKLDGINDA